MKDFFQALQDAFPVLRNHPVLMARLTLAAVVLAALYLAKNVRKKLCHPMHSKLRDRIVTTSRSLRVYQNSEDMADWKYYTSEVTGRGDTGDDIIWTLVHWPSLTPKDTFRVHGAFGTVEGIRDSQAKLLARWQIVYDPAIKFIGAVPARGLRSVLRRAAAKVFQVLGSSF